MENTEPKRMRDYISQHKILFIIIAIVLVMLALILLFLLQRKNDSEYTPTYLTQEFDPTEISNDQSSVASSALAGFSEKEIQQLRDELSEAHAELERANAEKENETNALLAELESKKAELALKTPPALDFKKIIGMYEGYGELVTLTYSYEVSVEAKSEGNILTNKKILYMIPGTLKIGVNFDTVKNGITANADTNTVTVTIPPAFFISNEIDEGNVERYDVSRGVFSKVEDKDYLNVAVDSKAKAEEQVTKNGMLQYAQRLAGLEFIGLLEPITSKSGYQIIVVYQ